MTSGVDERRVEETELHPQGARSRPGVASFGGGDGPTFGDVMREFVRRYGWRAYALPVLLVLTVAALMTTSGGGRATPRPAAA